MSENDVVFRYIPDKPGKGGDKSGLTTHMGVVDIHRNINAQVYAGRWRNIVNGVLYTTGSSRNPNAEISGYCNAIHIYYQYTTSPTAEPTTFLLAHHTEYGSGNNNVLWNHTDANYIECFKDATVYTGAFVNGSAAVTSVNPVVFGGDIGLRLSVHADHTGYYSDDHFTVIAAGGTALTLSSNFTGVNGTYSFVMAKRVLNNPTNYATSIAKFVNVKNRCFISWGNSYWGNLIFDTSFGGTNPSISYPMGVPAPVNNITYTAPVAAYSGNAGVSGDLFKTRVTLPSAPATFPFTLVMDSSTYSVLSVTSATTAALAFNVGASGYTFDTLPCPQPLAVGSTLNFPTASVVTSITSYNGTNYAGTMTPAQTPGAANRTVTVNTYFLSSSYSGQTNSAMPYTAATPGLVWTNQGPSYAVARYNPTTGHVSNIGPITQVSEINQNIASLTLQIPVDGAASDWYQAGYSRLVIFRTQLAAPGGNLYPIGDPTIGATDPDPANWDDGIIPNLISDVNPMVSGTQDFVDSFPDTNLLNNSTFLAPQNTNNPPPTFTQMAFWDGCVWGVPASDQSEIRYSAAPNQVLFGVPEESFPSLNSLRVPAEDGKVLGMRVIGPTLVITTQRYAYNLVGSSGVYRLLRFSTAMSGVSHERFCEWTGDASENGDRIAFIGNDFKVYRFTPGMGTELLSAPVASILDTEGTNNGSDLSKWRIHQAIAQGYRYLVVYTTNKVLAFDYENGTWHDIQLSPQYFQAMTQIYSAQTAPIQLFGFKGACYQWLKFSGTTTGTGASVTTFSIDGGDPTILKQLFGIRVWVSDYAMVGDIMATVISDDGISLNGETRVLILPFIYDPDPVRSPQYAGPSAYKQDSLNATSLVAYVAATSSSAPFVGHRFTVTIEWGTAYTTAPRDVYEFDVMMKRIPKDG